MTAPANARKFVRWGGSGTISFARGSGATVNASPLELMRAQTSTPAAWSLVLAVNNDSPNAGGVNLVVSFVVTLGLGSTQTQITRTVTISNAAPSGDVLLLVPGDIVAVTVTATPSAGPGDPVTLSVVALASPLAPESFTPC